MADVLTTGAEFLKLVLSKVPEGQRETVAAAFGAPEASEAVKFLGEGVLMRQDYSRNQDSVAQERARTEAWKKQLDDWWTEKQPIVAAAEAAHDPANLAATVVRSTPMTLPDDVVRKADFLKEIDQREMGAARFMAVTTSLAIKHFKEFGEELDVADLMADPRATQIGLPNVYHAKYGDRYKAKADAATTAAIDKRVADQLAEERKKFSRTPYPVSALDSGSPLDALVDPTKQSPFSVETAADEYADLVAKKLGGAAVPA